MISTKFFIRISQPINTISQHVTLKIKRWLARKTFYDLWLVAFLKCAVSNVLVQL